MEQITSLWVAVLILVYLVTAIIVGLLAHRWHKATRRASDQRLTSLTDQVKRLLHIAETLVRLYGAIDARISTGNGGYEKARGHLREGMDTVQVARRLGLDLGEVELISRLMELNAESSDNKAKQ